MRLGARQHQAAGVKWYNIHHQQLINFAAKPSNNAFIEPSDCTVVCDLFFVTLLRLCYPQLVLYKMCLVDESDQD